MTSNQIRWAAQHDWFQGWEYFNDFSHDKVAIVRETLVGPLQEVTTNELRFSDFQQLYAWAGY